MTSGTRIIVLHLTKTGEKTIVLHTLSKDYGRRGFIVNMGRGVSMSLFQPLSILDANMIGGPGSRLSKLSNISPAFPLFGLRGNMSKNAITMFMSEVLYRTIRDGIGEEDLYRWCESSILTLDAMDNSYANYHLRFLIELCSILGFSPSLESLGPFIQDNKLSDALNGLLHAGFGDFMMFPLRRETRDAIAGVLLDYLSFHTESRIEVQSLRVLRELFG